MQILLNKRSHNGTNELKLTRQRASGKSKSLQASDTQTRPGREKGGTLYRRYQEDDFTGQLCNLREREEGLKDATEASTRPAFCRGRVAS